MRNLTQEFSDLVGLRKDSWECYPGFIDLTQKKQIIEFIGIKYKRPRLILYMLYVIVQKK